MLGKNCAIPACLRLRLTRHPSKKLPVGGFAFQSLVTASLHLFALTWTTALNDMQSLAFPRLCGFSFRDKAWAQSLDQDPAEALTGE
jgi:hypothetical protein